MRHEQFDVVIVGGGIAGGALGAFLARAGIEVLILERQQAYHDLVRGEMLSPWGVEEAARMGVADAVYATDPGPLRKWVQWDEIYCPDEAPVVDLTQTFVPGVDTPLSIEHWEVCRSMVARATALGAVVRMGADDVRVHAGPRPSVDYRVDGESVNVACRLVVGAGGRRMPVARQCGVRLQKSAHHWGGGLAVEGLEGWPSGVQAMGTEGDVMFFVFPRGNGKARLYLNYPEKDRYRCAGPQGAQRFIEAFDLKCMPYSDAVLQSKPSGPVMTSPSLSTSTDRQYVEGVVLIGDEAGSNDPVLGTGLSNGLRDARVVGELLQESRDWTTNTFAPYAAERGERMRRLNFSAGLVSAISAEFGPKARERRKRAWERMRENPNYMVVLMVSMAGPDRVPEFGFSEFLAERLLSPDRDAVARPPRLLRVPA